MDPKRVEQLRAKEASGQLTFDEYVELLVEVDGETADQAERMYPAYLAKHDPEYGVSYVY